MNLQYNSANCFACGLENPCGLRLRFYDNGEDQVVAQFSLNSMHAGYPGIAHGGVVAAVLDEVAGRTVMIGNPNCFFVTAHMDVRYRHPVPVETPLEAVGWMRKHRASRTLAEAKIYSDTREVLAEATILYTSLPNTQFDLNEVESRFGWKLYDS